MSYLDFTADEVISGFILLFAFLMVALAIAHVLGSSCDEEEGAN